MKRWLLVLAVAAASCLAVGAQALAKPWQSVQPACADITSGTGDTFAFRQGNDMLGELGTGEAFVLAQSCYAVNFTMVVVSYSSRTGDMFSVNTDTLQDAFEHPAEDYRVGVFHVVMPPAAYVCVSFVSSWPRGGLFGGMQLDIAPDNGCPTHLNLAQPWPFPFNVMAPGDNSVAGGFE